MKKSLLLFLMVLISSFVFAQETIKFLGIPVDGTKSDMIQKLEDKGYIYKQTNGGYLEGEFNGQDVHIFIHTNKNKVDRIMVASQRLCNESEIITEFNNLLYSFEKSDKYIASSLYGENTYIDRKEDISYEMSVHNKQYRAFFTQVMTKEEATQLKNNISENFDTICSLIKSNEFPLDKDSKELFAFIDNDSVSKEQKVDNICGLFLLSSMTSNTVWFSIAEYYGEYYMVIFYDNENNRPKGEDL